MGNAENSFPASQYSIRIVQRECENKKALGEKESNKHTWEMDEMIDLSLQFSWLDDMVIEFTFVLR